jgi:hypothetical protein
MSSDQIQKERELYAKPRHEPARISGRAWVRRDLELWHRCTIERYSSTSVTVSLDNMDELTVDPDDVAQFDLEPGTPVFYRHWEGSLSGFAALVHRVKGESVDIAFPAAFYGNGATWLTTLLRELRVYHDLWPIAWKMKARVFAYRAVPFDYVYKAVELKPERFLMYPGRVQGIHHDVCVQVEFVNGETAYVPITLVERLDVSQGDTVFTCTSYISHGTNPDARWTPCRVLERDGENLLLRDGAGEQFETPIGMVAILPKGFQMFDGKFERIPYEPAHQSEDARPRPPISANVHIVRTDRWENTADDPITKAQVDAVIGADPELAWSAPEWESVREDDATVIRHFSILWNGQPTFWWYRHEIRCPRPTMEQLAKMIEMAITLDANVLGDDGEEYH